MANDREKLTEVLNSLEYSIDTFTDDERKTLADIMYWIIARDEINLHKLAARFSVDPTSAKTMVEFLINKKFLIVYKSGKIKVTDNIPKDLEWNLKHFYNDIDIEYATKGGLPQDKKKEISNILTRTNYDWFAVDEHVPENDNVVAIRIENRGDIVDESRADIEYAEAVYLARYVGTEWKIEPPHLLYDLSTMTKEEKVSDNEKVHVTHWAEVSEDEIERWEHRLDILGDYGWMKFEVDGYEEEKVYKAITLASSIISNNLQMMPENAFKDEVAYAYRVLIDIQNTMDQGGIAYGRNWDPEEGYC